MKRVFATAVLAASSMSTGKAAAAEEPVKITFDPSSSRADLAQGAKLPAAVTAEPGSVRFHLLRLDEGEEVVYYMFDQLRSVRVADLAAMEKDQGEFAIWNLFWRNGQGLHPRVGPRVHPLVVSFVPAGAGGKDGGRVYYKLNDLKRIQWADLKE